MTPRRRPLLEADVAALQARLRAGGVRCLACYAHGSACRGASDGELVAHGIRENALHWRPLGRRSTVPGASSTGSSWSFVDSLGGGGAVPPWSVSAGGVGGAAVASVSWRCDASLGIRDRSIGRLRVRRNTLHGEKQLLVIPLVIHKPLRRGRGGCALTSPQDVCVALRGAAKVDAQSPGSSKLRHVGAMPLPRRGLAVSRLRRLRRRLLEPCKLELLARLARVHLQHSVVVARDELVFDIEM